MEDPNENGEQLGLSRVNQNDNNDYNDYYNFDYYNRGEYIPQNLRLHLYLFPQSENPWARRNFWYQDTVPEMVPPPGGRRGLAPPPGGGGMVPNPRGGGMVPNPRGGGMNSVPRGGGMYSVPRG